MKELGDNLRTARENMGISLEEVANDLAIDKSYLDNLEEGNTRAFKDILSLKEMTSAYAKYLGLDQESILDEFNDFVFASTSKISVEDIKEASKRTKDRQEKKIFSPYTIEMKKKSNVGVLIVSGILVLLVLTLVFFLLKTKIIG